MPQNQFKILLREKTPFDRLIINFTIAFVETQEVYNNIQ
jgi:hypothetical protein